MTGYTVHTGSTEEFSNGWDRIFGGKAGQSGGKKSSAGYAKKKAGAQQKAKKAKKRKK